MRASPSIKYEIELFAVGLQRNPRINTSIADCSKILSEYLGRWKTLDPTEEWTIAICASPDRDLDMVVVGGVYGLYHEDRVKFFVLGSISRGIPRREWEIPAKEIKALAFTFYPQANVVAVAGSQPQQRPEE